MAYRKRPQKTVTELTDFTVNSVSSGRLGSLSDLDDSSGMGRSDGVLGQSQQSVGQTRQQVFAAVLPTSGAHLGGRDAPLPQS